MRRHPLWPCRTVVVSRDSFAVPFFAARIGTVDLCSVSKEIPFPQVKYVVSERINRSSYRVVQYYQQSNPEHRALSNYNE
jgi:hypothetical protein